MNFDNLNFEELDNLAVQYLVFDTKELAYILKGHLYVERILEALIRKKISKFDNLAKHQLSFNFKVDLAVCLDVLPEKLMGPIKALNKIRNKYAHDSSYQVNIGELNALKFEWEPIQYKAFNEASNKGVEDAVMIATLFLCWKCIHLITSYENKSYGAN
ncbi:hypothetical protein OQX63_17315 [Pedobacter sp. PF22-3]|uniref:hypothetical protein n=1 Tax=Pedobacter sp. PF22-3 TaxID=2994467 RepID=UPI002247DBC7|nr:hypothetical protein [Pedobacter sp. PF22-3]MCX2495253.1 hypothetical protein [Pedobacter sp. PF22-3]